MHWLNVVKDIVEFFYYLAGIGLFGTLVVGLVQLKILKKDLHDRNKRAAVEKSLELLQFYADTLLPTVGKYRSRLKKEIENPQSIKHLLNESFKIDMNKLDKEVIAENIVRDRIGVIDILNKMEFFSTAVLNGVADEKLIFTPVAKDFCNTVEEEFVILSILRSSGGPPFKNLVELYNKWNNKLKLEELKIKVNETKEKMSVLEKGNEIDPPIGF